MLLLNWFFRTFSNLCKPAFSLQKNNSVPQNDFFVISNRECC